jgi:hypothetical protein
MASNMSLRYLDLNRQINQDYGALGARFQAILDPAFNRMGVSDAYPAWFAFAAFASRAIGQAQLGADIGLDAARFYHETGDHQTAMVRLLPADLVRPAAALIDTLVDGETRLAATFLVGVASANRHQGAFQGLALSGLLDPRTFRVSVERLLALMLEAPGSNPIEQLGSVALTLRNMMEDGNRRIYGDIGGAAQDYLCLRESWDGSVTADRVLQEFAPSNFSRPDLTHAAYDFALQHLQDNPLPIHFDQSFPGMLSDARPLVVAAFALYEQAGQTSELVAKNRYIAFANNYVIYREQHDAVQPAFSPGQILPDEVDRTKLLAIITPTIEVVLRLETWKFWEYAEKYLPARELNPLVSRVTQYNWGVFEDRWAPVVDTFGPCYRHPRAMWPPPNADASQAL